MHFLPTTIPLSLKLPKMAAPAVAPEHLGIVVSGHRHWARVQSRLKSADLPGTSAMLQGLHRSMETIELCLKRRIQRLTLYVFTADFHLDAGADQEQSTELLLEFLRGMTKSLHFRGVSLRVVGDTQPLSPHLRRLAQLAEQETLCNSTLQVIVSLDGAPTWDMGLAFRTWQASLPPHGQWTGQERASLDHHVMRATLPDPHLVIRTGGQIPGGHGMVWNTSRTALYFTDVPWPAFGQRHLHHALRWYSKPNRPAGVQVPSGL